MYILPLFITLSKAAGEAFARPKTRAEAEYWKKEAEKDFSSLKPVHVEEHKESETIEPKPDYRLQAAHHVAAFHAQNNMHRSWAEGEGDTTSRDQRRRAERAAHHWKEASRLIGEGHVPTADHFRQIRVLHKKNFDKKLSNIRSRPGYQTDQYTAKPSDESRHSHMRMQHNADYFTRHRALEEPMIPSEDQLHPAIRSKLSKSVFLYVRLSGDDIRKAIEVDKGAAQDLARRTNWGVHKRELAFDRPDIQNISFKTKREAKPKKRTAGRTLFSAQQLESGAEKAIQGQQELMQPIGPQDPAYATHAQSGKPSEDIHIEAAKHYIQADYHGRHPGGWNQAQENHKQYMNLRKQGANPQARHFKAAMQELHPKFTQTMKSQPGLFVSI